MYSKKIKFISPERKGKRCFFGHFLGEFRQGRFYVFCKKCQVFEEIGEFKNKIILKNR